MRRVLLTAVVLMPLWAAAADDAEPRKVAETYLNALTGAASEAGKDLLLGGVTMNAQLFTLDNWSLKSKDPVLREEGDTAHALQMMNDLDRAGRQVLHKMLGAVSSSDMTVTEFSESDAQKLMAPMRERMVALQKAHPLLANVLRVDKEVYWHPKNPMRAVLVKAGGPGKYSLELHRWIVLSKEGAAKTPREWPLRVLRFKSAKLDTGWKVLPASDWNAESRQAPVLLDSRDQPTIL